MFWYKTKLKTAIVFIGGIALSALVPACRPGIKNNGGFDLTGYLKKDAAMLNKLNRPVDKTVTHNGVTETKTVHIADWSSELGLFIDADINKPAFKNSYQVIDEDGLLVYKAKEKDLKVRELIIKRTGGGIRYVLIYNKVENPLYKTTQKLTYFPDSVYRIETVQHVKLLGTNTYFIQGILK
ncbi:hypothetical protein [Mucilaginibacter gotjawali]|uniref:Uncharacterized protein n=2 Tax=Mucilaginibacter gotjawali TaxID=1550579 RepID=A0A110B1W7_9SPHI|nr:hypothetical protein [Mucilaginibacter gotjawali]MBB3055554.1 hypothetical protein [Mucilaginibacter gotjawali]BAU53166.1 hypothetical protein MgSA37_01333 [Mucilaginibacter gotjawali]